ncbi:GNAT family N-acetyltransferase [Devosia sp. BK]|uniref:GNAT family N-acetyltransferase n=1 Tax=unclassified Devosia TaxID=196773 RepID=UPI000714F7F7|nr:MULTISPECIES: GNAT family N-acetyltransferase [unclassified Devosia]KQN75065.1 hypothetical protein ASE94_01730 [Devosia sp. Leaf64]MDV3251961.1 GNAT family N-acetyltransferase [Devosia sp. BK]
MKLRKFAADDWPWVQEWFQDALLNLELGPMDQAWLEAVLGDHNGVQLVASIEDVPVALIGCIWGADEHPSHYITDIAVSPKLRGQGFGLRALQLVMAWPAHPPTSKWTAFVNPQNHRAQSLLRKASWLEFGMSDGMLKFETS